MDVNDALLKLKMEPFEELGFAKLDSHRGLRQGVAEVINYCENKIKCCTREKDALTFV